MNSLLRCLHFLSGYELDGGGESALSIPEPAGTGTTWERVSVRGMKFNVVSLSNTVLRDQHMHFGIFSASLLPIYLSSLILSLHELFVARMKWRGKHNTF